MKITYFGHDAFLFSDEENAIIIDPFLNGNENTNTAPEDIKVSHILLTHGHGDHLGDGIQIAQNNNATIIAPYELATYCSSKGVNTHPMHIGGAYDFGFFRVKLTIAHHGSAVVEEDGRIIYTGNPCGMLITIGGKTIYHAGDTGIFLDMELIGRLNKIDVALLPIGGNFTMDVDDAVEAAKMLKAELTIPMHYKTFPVIDADPEIFAQKCNDQGIKTTIIDFDQSLEI